jgi:uncharacterized protein YjbJ (UPF0337 family)
MKAKGKRQKAKGKSEDARRAKFSFSFLPFAFCLLPFAFRVAVCLLPFAFHGCAVDERRNIPVGAQATVDRVTEDIAAGRDAKVYEEAAEEWRVAVSAGENEKILGRVRERLGRVENRALHTGREQAAASPPLSGHTLELVYNTRFERGEAMERFTLLERGGGWLLAGYSVSSDVLK